MRPDAVFVLLLFQKLTRGSTIVPSPPDHGSVVSEASAVVVPLDGCAVVVSAGVVVSVGRAVVVMSSPVVVSEFFPLPESHPVRRRQTSNADSIMYVTVFFLCILIPP